MLKKLDTRAINALLKRQLLLSPKLQRRYRAPNMDSMIFELRKLKRYDERDAESHGLSSIPFVIA